LLAVEKRVRRRSDSRCVVVNGRRQMSIRGAHTTA
jgi:hypothetical protein